ncbi:hypothetical protein LSAT2_012849 [Lamellibrachia satsuma]|nr:hypothetical protein LSAT2_012849 [Lamellibrachia satsuma]
MPFVSTGCTSSILSNKRTFDTFSRVVAPWVDLSAVFLSLLKHMNWNRVAIIMSTERVYSDTGLELEQAFSEANIVTFIYSIDYFLDDKVIQGERLPKVLTDEALINLFQQHLLKFLEEMFGEKPKKVFYLSDGCAGQYKNCKNFMNLCRHSVDLGAEWHFLLLHTSRGSVMVLGAY